MKKAVPILILDNTFSFGGAINSICYLIAALDKKRFVPVLVTGQPREFLNENFDCNCHTYVPKLPWVNNRIYKKIATLPLFRLRLLRKALNLCRFFYWNAFVLVLESLYYYRFGRRYGVALVHLNNLPSLQFSGILAAKFLRVPCVAHLRDFEFFHPVARFYVRLVDHHVAISGAVRDSLRKLGVPDERITVVHDAIDPQKFRPSAMPISLCAEFGLAPDQPLFGLFGRVAAWKGIREFIVASRQVIDEIPSAVGFVVGGETDGGENGYLRDMQRLAAELGLADKIIFTGYRKDVSTLMGLMDVIVHASIRPEPFGMVIIEGMAMGKPVVATRGGGALDIIIDGENGLLVEMGDVVALGLAVSSLLQHPELRKKMGTNGRARVERLFNSQRYANEMESIYQRLTEKV